jgi:hypothetical protein
MHFSWNPMYATCPNLIIKNRRKQNLVKMIISLFLERKEENSHKSVFSTHIVCFMLFDCCLKKNPHTNMLLPSTCKKDSCERRKHLTERACRNIDKTRQYQIFYHQYICTFSCLSFNLHTAPLSKSTRLYEVRINKWYEVKEILTVITHVTGGENCLLLHQTKFKQFIKRNML